LAERHGLTVYDAAYLDLALREGLPLASLDHALCKAAGNSGVVSAIPPLIHKGSLCTTSAEAPLRAVQACWPSGTNAPAPALTACSLR
jgi:hypothetical protein